MSTRYLSFRYRYLPTTPHNIFLIIYIFIFEVHANLKAFIHIRSRYQLDIRLPDIDTY